MSVPKEQIEWNDGYWFEARDRCHTIMIMVQELLEDHPAIEKAELSGIIESVQTLMYKAMCVLAEKEDEEFSKIEGERNVSKSS
jgi:hypothetical protein